MAHATTPNEIAWATIIYSCIWTCRKAVNTGQAMLETF